MRTLFISTIAIGLAAGMGVAAAGSINLSQDQQKQIANELNAQSAQQAPSGFTAKAGEKAPSGVNLSALPDKVAQQFPTLKNDKFAKFDNNKVIIVDPNNSNEIVAVIDESSMATTGANANESEMNNNKAMPAEGTGAANDETNGATNMKAPAK